MSQVRAISAIARADFLERVRRYSFFLTLLFAIFLGYAAATGRIAISLGEHRGVYTSAWIGALVAVTTMNDERSLTERRRAGRVRTRTSWEQHRLRAEARR